MHDLRATLAYVLWIGGATDAGKTTVAGLLAERHGLQLYNYDRNDVPHHERLAQTSLMYQAFLDASLDERWVEPEPEALLERALQSFQDRWPFVLEDLLALPRTPGIVAEGFGLTPAILAPLLTSLRQAIWLVPTPAFKHASMQRRNKPAWAAQTRDPARATANLLQRDRLLADEITAQAQARGLRVLEVDGTQAVEAVAAQVEQHFGLLR